MGAFFKVRNRQCQMNHSAGEYSTKIPQYIGKVLLESKFVFHLETILIRNFLIIAYLQK